MDIDKIIKLHEAGLTAEQIQAVVDLEPKVETPQPVVTTQVEEPAPVVEQPQVDINKIAEQVAILNQRSVSVEPIEKQPVVDEKPDYTALAESVILGFQY